MFIIETREIRSYTWREVFRSASERETQIELWNLVRNESTQLYRVREVIAVSVGDTTVMP